MKLLFATWIVTCDDDFTIYKDSAIVFDEKIIEIGSEDIMRKKYKNIKHIDCGENSVIMPGLINSHTHLEFSANKTKLKYGNFIVWLNSVMQNREDIIEKSTKKLIDEELSKMLQNGTTTIGAISSYGLDLPSCVDTPINVVYFNEAIGSKADMADTLLQDFKGRYESSKLSSSKSFTPAIAVHSPYSVHPFLVREVLKMAKIDDVPVSAHFLESEAEKQWLESSSGDFKEFFETNLNQSISITTQNEFLLQFKKLNNLSFTHCSEINEEQQEIIKTLGASIIHCPVSNRLLTNSTLEYTKINDIDIALGTDGLSSNISLNLFDEMRNAIFIHQNDDLALLSQKLLLSGTKNGAKALGKNSGELSVGKNSDIISFCIPDEVINEDDLALQIILHNKTINCVYISGEKIV